MKIHKSICLLFIATVSILCAASAGAATCSVPTATYPTIQSAVDDSVCDTINVAPGVYNENLSIPRSLTLNGAQAGQLVAGRTSGGIAESTLRGANPTGSMPVISINATHVTVDGFTISNSVIANAATGIDIKPTGNDPIIRNNIIDGIVTSELGATGTAQAIFLESGPIRVELLQNKIQNVAGSQASRGIFIGDGAASNHTDNVYIHNNTITGITSSDGGAYGLLVATPAGTSGINFVFNDLSNLEGGTLVHGVGLECDTDISIVQYNNFTNLIGPATDNAAVWFADNPNAFRAAVNGNNFNLTIMSYGIGVQAGLTSTSGPMSGQCNWWGSADGPGPVGPGHGARVSPGILYASWLEVPLPSPELINVLCTGNNVPATEAQCKEGGWTLTVRADGTPFKNQGDCVQYVNTGH